MFAGYVERQPSCGLTSASGRRRCTASEAWELRCGTAAADYHVQDWAHDGDDVETGQRQRRTGTGADWLGCRARDAGKNTKGIRNTGVFLPGFTVNRPPRWTLSDDGGNN
jgi:hypothetical protein